MTAEDRRAWTVTIFVAMALSGVILQMRGAVLPTLQSTFGTPSWQLGLVAPAGMIGYTLVILVTGFGAGYFAPRRLVALGLVGGGLMVAAMGLSPVFAVFVLATVLHGGLNGILRGLNRPLLSHFYPDARGRVFNYYDMIWAVGAMLGPVVIVAAVAMGSWRLGYFAVAVVWVVLGVTVLWRSAPALSTSEDRFTAAEVVPLLRRPEIVAMSAAMILGVGVEASLFTWLPIYATQVLPETITLGLLGADLTLDLAELTLTVMLAGYVPGRFVYAALSERFGYARLLVGILALVVPVYATTFLFVDGLAILIGIFAIGALISGLYPMLVTYASEAMPEHTGPITALAATMAAIGFGVIPAVLGGVISAQGAARAMEYLLAPLVGALAVVILARAGEVRAARRS